MVTKTTQSGGNRNRLLYAVMVVVVSLYLFDFGYRKMYRDPKAVAEARIESLGKKIQAEKLRVAKAKKANRILPDLQQRALPYRLEEARSAYQSWLLGIGETHRINGLNVDSGEPINHAYRGQLLYHSIPFTLRGRASLKDVSEFLHAFYSAGHLHKIRTMSLNPAGSDVIAINLSIDTVSMPTADRETDLTEVKSDRLVSDSAGEYGAIATRNLFQVGGHGIGRHVVFNAATSNVRGEQEAWFEDLRTEKTYRCKLGGAVTVGSLVFNVIAIEKKHAIVKMDGQQFKVGRGQSLADAILVTPETVSQ